MPGTVSSEADTPRSYLVDTPSGPIQKIYIIDLNLNLKQNHTVNSAKVNPTGS